MKSTLTLAIIFLFPIFLVAQEEYFDSEYPSGRAFLNIVPEMEIGFPIGNFRNKIGHDALVGKGISIFYRLKNKPIDIGLHFGDIPYDKISREFEDSVYAVDLVQKTKNKIWLYYGTLRYEPKVNLPFQPYIESSVGVSRFFSKTFTRETWSTLDEDEDNSRFDKATLNSDWGMTYGAAIGSYFILEKTFNTSIDFQVGYRMTSIGDFLVKNDLDEIQEIPIENFDERTGAVSLLSIKIGISILVFTE